MSLKASDPRSAVARGVAGSSELCAVARHVYRSARFDRDERCRAVHCGEPRVSNAQATWVISSYSVAAAIAVPLTGWLSQRFGDARLFVWSVLLFTLTSLLCGIASNLEMLVCAARCKACAPVPWCRSRKPSCCAPFRPRNGYSHSRMAMTCCSPRSSGRCWAAGSSTGFPALDFFINLPIGLFAFAACRRSCGATRPA